MTKEYNLGGASKPKPDNSLRVGNKQYKRVHQRSLRAILRNELQRAEKFLNQYLLDHPNDQETHFMLGILHGQKGDIAQAEDSLAQAIKLGLPEDRIVAGPRKMFEPLSESKLVKEVFQKYQNRLVHGPLLGNVTNNSASVWVRTAQESTVIVIVYDANGDEISRGKSKTKASDDFTAVVKVDGLRALQKYDYKVFIDGQQCEVASKTSFRTFPEPGTASKFSIAFGGGAGYVPQNERMWGTIGGQNPDAILLLGDNVYIDDPESKIMQQYTYHRRQSRPQWRFLTAGVPVFTIWDDHDFSTDDSWGGADVAIPFWKKDIVFPVFRQNWANPSYGGGEEQPGCWYKFQIGDVDFFMLDCRYYRTDPGQPSPSMLGPVQTKWLKKQLLESSGTFKVVCSSVPWDYRTKGGSLDTWNGYKQEREEIFAFIEANKIEGIILMSADRHRSDAWKISRSDGYDFFEFNSSRLTNQHVHPTMENKGAIFSYNKLQSFGIVTFDTTANDPSATYEVVNIDGEKPHSINVKRSELKSR